ncbi:hypothetical protein ACFQZE_12655 [Paenibacillus sp. GCM10027627]|uniref:XkdQ/YqbQ family protein n=1 Tax=unclassified Paenibacillus TaxID=185978 RepID=UPI003636DFCE
MMEIYYQNINTGMAHDITTLVTSAEWKTARVGSPAALELSVLYDSEVVIDHGGIVSLKVGSNGLFYGYIFKHSNNGDGTMKCTAYDQIRYLKNKDTYSFKNKRADEIVSKIAADFKMKTGKLENTEYVIPLTMEDGQTLLDIILKALDKTLVYGGKMFYLWDDFGKLSISNMTSTLLNLIVGDNSLMTDFDYSSSIDGETANKIKLVRKNEETGMRDVYVVQDSDNQKRWGILQHYEELKDGLNEAQAEQLADNLLSLKNRPDISLSVNGVSNLNVRAGRAVFVELKDVGVSGWYVIDECSHNLVDQTMSLKMMVM